MPQDKSGSAKGLKMAKFGSTVIAPGGGPGVGGGNQSIASTSASGTSSCHHHYHHHYPPKHRRTGSGRVLILNKNKFVGEELGKFNFVRFVLKMRIIDLCR